MSQYQIFLKDFPNRCQKILTRYFDPAKLDDVEVTLMLSIASSAFILAFEGLRDKKSLLGDPQKRYPNALKTFDDFLGERFLKSSVIGSAGKWELITKHDSTEPPWNGPLNGDYALSDTVSTFYILDLIRNSLAHGNIRTLPNPNNQIETIVFIVWSRNYYEKDDRPEKRCDKSKYDLLAVSETDFRKFLHEWLTFLQGLSFSD